MNWWLLLPGTTRSLPELGRETGTRQWYFGLSRGRVGHCQFFLNEAPIRSLLLSSLLFPPPVRVGDVFYPISQNILIGS